MPAAAQLPASSPLTPGFAADSSLGSPVDTAAAEPTRVGRVRVAGNVATDSLRILRTFEVTSGSRYSEDALRRGLRKLFALGLFDDVWLEKFTRGDAVDVVIHVRERPRIGRLEFSGNKKKDTNDLEKKVHLRVGDVYSPSAVQVGVDSLLKFYRDEGYAQASIESAVDTTAGAGQIGVRFVVREGEKVKISRIEFEGVSAFPAKKLKKQLKTKTRGFFGGGEVKDENFVEDQEKLERYYRSNGYRDMRLLGHELLPGDSPRRLTLKFQVEEGPRYRFGDISWGGNHVVASTALEKLWKKGKKDEYDVSKIEKTQGLAYAEYAEQGYLYVNVDPRETVHDDRVDVAFTLTEGEPSVVRLVNILGNKGTREKVIRREMDIHEGDRFKRSALVRTQGDIFRLGIFEDVQIDFAPAETTSVDLNLKVKEKQVGTASAGAGYTNQSGLTGFLELGHNNVLGNGQSVSLHLERGARRSDYSVSFTEPWFRDTPTLLGFSAFDTERELDLYNDKRIGGSGRIGRPLPWPDYSRGSITYRLENVTITQLGGALTPEDSIALSGIRVGEGTLTSSSELNFLRNSTDNPFYPTKGSRASIESEFAGGPMGGAVNFHKHRIEGRAYLPSLTKGLTTMLRARVGLLGRYPDQNSGVPTYERFRLGGGTTVDPLRGYDDYQVVPEKFIRNVKTGQRLELSFPAPGDTDSVYVDVFQKVRYPGGRFMTIYSVEQQFPIVHPLHGVLFFDAGNTWDEWREIKPFDLKLGAGVGFRIEIPLLGNIGFDYGYGFNRDDGPRAKGHFLLGNVNF